MSRKIVVLGSANIDHIAKVRKIPDPGETIGDGYYSKAFGGKGFNQAVAATKAGGEVEFLACVGNDEDGKQIIATISGDGAETSNVIYCPGFPTGAAFIFVDEKGENSIVVTPGANKEMKVEHVTAWSDIIARTDFLVMQMEIPYECVSIAAEIAHKNNTFVLLNPAPACEIDSKLMAMVDLLVVNETESEIISGRSLSETGLEGMASILMKLGAKSVIITLGSAGSYLYNRAPGEPFAAYRVDAVDSTAAGDTFCGAMVAYLASNQGGLGKAIEFASAAAALSVQKLGAYPSVPVRNEIDHFISINK